MAKLNRLFRNFRRSISYRKSIETAGKSALKSVNLPSWKVFYVKREPVPCSQIVEKTRKKKARGKMVGRVSFLPLYFRVCAFSVKRTRLSRSLEQVSQKWENAQTCPSHINEWLSTWRKHLFVILERIINFSFIPKVSMVYFNVRGKHTLTVADPHLQVRGGGVSQENVFGPSGLSLV